MSFVICLRLSGMLGKVTVSELYVQEINHSINFELFLIFFSSKFHKVNLGGTNDMHLKACFRLW